jgi:hypothetical protein
LLRVARSAPKEVVRSNNAGSFAGGKRGTSLSRLIGKVSSLGKGKRLEVMVSTHDGTVDLAWLVDALKYTHGNGQTRVVDYLEAVLDDVVFEMESAARKG